MTILNQIFRLHTRGIFKKSPFIYWVHVLFDKLENLLSLILREIPSRYWPRRGHLSGSVAATAELLTVFRAVHRPYDSLTDSLAVDGEFLQGEMSGVLP